VITKEDLLKEISNKELIELTDLNATGNLNEQVLNDAITDAISFISSFFKIPKNPTPLLKQIATELTIFNLRKKNQLTDSKYKEKLKEIESYLLKMANKKIPITLSQEQKEHKNSTIATKKRGKKLNLKGWL
jgi:phage gp36-like protein